MGRPRRYALLVGAVALSGGSLGVHVPAATAAGGGLFHPYASYQPGSSAANVDVGDVTGDGRSDVLLTTDYSADPATDFSLWVYPQLTDGGLGSPTQLRTGGTYGSDMAVALADLDEDGDLDAAVTTDDGVEIYLQHSTGLAYEWTVPIPEGRDLDLVDVSGDGLADLVVNAQSGIEVWWQIRGDFMPSPAGSMLTSSFRTEVEVADVTGDGLADVVAASGSTVEIHAQRPDHSFAAPVGYGSGGLDGWTRINGLAVGDTDGDGLADVHASVGGNRPNSWVVTRAQLPDGTLGEAVLHQTYDIPESLEVADVTGDGRGDLVVVHGGWNQLGVYDSTPGTDPAESLYPIPYASHYDADALAIGDVTGDARPDVAIADYNNGLVLLRGAATGADVTAPDTTITSGPSGTHRSRNATFGFTATESSTFTCSLDGSAWSVCTSPKVYEGLSSGAHTFRVRATDAAGNTDTTPAQRTIVVDGPETTISSGPSGTVRSTSATFGFGSSTAAHFECSMDSGAWAVCGSPVTFTELKTATAHTFRVRAVGADGLVDSSPASRTFIVDAAADLGVSLSAKPDPVKRGESLSYTARVTNGGPDAASSVVLTQSLPAGLSFTSSSAPCNVQGSPTILRCEIGTLAPGTTWTVTVDAKVTVSKGSLASTAVVTSATWELDPANDSASTSSRVGKGR